MAKGPDVAMVFAARFLIRLASLLPDEVDLRQTGRDVEDLASRLDEGVMMCCPLALRLTRAVPGFSHGRILQQVLGKARKERVIPPKTQPASPDMTLPDGTLSKGSKC